MLKPQLLKNRKIQICFFWWVVLCVACNIVFLRLTALLNLPIYLDTIGTILMALVWGYLPGILVSVLTQIIYGFFIPDSVCYALIGVFVAIRASVFVQNEKKDFKKLICFIADSALICGLLGASFQWLLLEGPQLEYVEDTARLMAGNDKTVFFIGTVVLIIALNIIDKIITILVACGIYRFIPVKIRETLWNSNWKQTPISVKERKEITQNIKHGTPSLMVKVLVILMLVTVFTSVILGVVSARVNYEESKTRGKEMAADIAKYAASTMEPKFFEGFTATNAKVYEYRDVKYIQYNDMLLSLKKSIPLIGRLSVYYVKGDSIYAIFDTDDRYQISGTVGEKLERDKMPEDLISFITQVEGEDVREKVGVYKDKITSFEKVPVSDKTSFYVGTEVSLESYGMFLKRYATKMILTFSGFFALILAGGFTLAAHNLVYPIGVLEKSIDRFMESIEDQDELDESVRELEKIDIRTNDELERLYNSICQMANTAAEQMRSVMTLAKSNEQMQAGLVATMADIVENQNIDSKAHIQKTTAYVRIILQGLKRKGYYAEKLTLKYMGDVEMSTPLYDIGKIKIPDYILNKPDELSDEEFEIMKTHTTEGRKILDNTISSMRGENYLKEARNMAAYHHERWDGKGYPEGLHGEVIPLSARVMAIADVFDAITSKRVYKSANSYQEALDVILEGSGTKFDPKCVEAFADSFGEVKNILRKYS